MQSSKNLIKFSSHLIQLRNLILRHPWRQYVRLPGSSRSRLLLHGMRLYGSHVSFLLQLFYAGVTSSLECPVLRTRVSLLCIRSRTRSVGRRRRRSSSCAGCRDLCPGGGNVGRPLTVSEVALRAGLLICSCVQHNGRLANRGARGQRHRESDRRGFCAADALKTRYFEMGLNAIATSRPVGVSLRMMLAKRAWTIKPNKQERVESEFVRYLPPDRAASHVSVLVPAVVLVLLLPILQHTHTHTHTHTATRALRVSRHTHTHSKGVQSIPSSRLYVAHSSISQCSLENF